MEEVLIKIAEQSLAAGVLIWIVIYFKGQISKKEKVIAEKDLEIKELNEILREDQTETLKAISSMTNVMKNVEILLHEKRK